MRKRIQRSGSDAQRNSLKDIASSSFPQRISLSEAGAMRNAGWAAANLAERSGSDAKCRLRISQRGRQRISLRDRHFRWEGDRYIELMGKEIEIILRIATGVYGNDTLVLVLLAYHTLFPQRYYPILPEPHPQTSKHNRISCKKRNDLLTMKQTSKAMKWQYIIEN